MNEIITTIIQLIVMLAILFVVKYAVPLLKTKISSETLSEIAEWARQAVLMAQQVMWDYSGEDKKAYVTEFLEELLIAKNFTLSDAQLEVLIESAVKEMKMQDYTSFAAESELTNFSEENESYTKNAITGLNEEENDNGQ